MIARDNFFTIACTIALLVSGNAGRAQTYTIGSHAQVTHESKTGQKGTSRQLGWGSNIRNARLARAAEMALRRGDHAEALSYAQRAAEADPSDPQFWFLLGYAARLDEQYQQSADAYLRGLRLDPGSLNGKSGLAQTYSQMGRTAEAERLLKEVLKQSPSQEDDLLALGNLYLQGGDRKDALKWLTQAERVRPNARAELLLAIIYERGKRMGRASYYLHLAERRAPNDPDVERSLAGYYRETGSYGKAIDELKSIHNPTPNVVAELAYTYELDGQPKEAAVLYSRAANAQPHNLQFQLSAAQAETALHSYGTARQYLTRAARISPNYYRLHAIRAEIAQAREQEQKAAKEYGEAIAALPASPAEGPLYGIQLHMDLESVYEKLNEPKRSGHQLSIAEAQIGALHEHGPDRAAFLRLRAQIEIDGGEKQSALKDVRASLALKPNDANSLLLNGDVLLKMGRTEDAIAAYRKALAAAPRSRFALIALAYAEVAAKKDRDAEKYFEELARDYPRLYVPYLGLGDLYTALGRYKRAEKYYETGYRVAPHNAAIVAGGINAAIEGHDLPLAGRWINRATGRIGEQPRVEAQAERYYSFKGNYAESAVMGRKAIQSLPRNRDVVVYLGYDLLNLKKYGELLALTKKYMNVLPKEPDIPLLAGYVYKHENKRREAVSAFTEALKRDPTIVTAYVNRGYVYNDMRKPALAAADFRQALKSAPKNGQAHLGLAFASLAMHHSSEAIRQSELAETYLGDSVQVHIIRATAYGREGLGTRAAAEYRVALKMAPTDGALYLGLGSVYFSQRRYQDAATQLQTAEKYLPADAEVYAMEARSYAHLQNRSEAVHYIELAERYAGKSGRKADRPSAIYVNTGEAFSTLGDQGAAMDRFSRALAASKSNRVNVRLAIAQLMERKGNSAGAERQIALAQMEADSGYTAHVTGPQYVEAASILQQMHDYTLAEKYLMQAQASGAPSLSVRVGLANSYLAMGDTRHAAAELALARRADGSESDYGFLLAEANLYQQEHRGGHALSAFAQAASEAGDDETAEQGLLGAGGTEGLRLNKTLSVQTNVLVHPLYDDSTVYVLDAKTFGHPPAIYGGTTNTALLPPPRSSIETEWTTPYRLHLRKFLPVAGFFQVRNAQGTISIPATGIVNRNTTDTSFNGGIVPTFHLGTNDLTFNVGGQGTIQRDSLSPRQMNQNIGRLFAYMNTSSFFNAVSVNAYVIRDAGPFTEIPLNEHTLSGSVNFSVGAPWAKTALVTGWGESDQHFTSKTLGNTENYFTSSYIGLTRRFARHLSIEAIAEYLRSWRIVPYVTRNSGIVTYSGIAQALRPAATINFSPARHWNVQISGAYEDTRTIHLYDMTENGFSVSYTRPFSRTFNEKTGKVHLKYPIRFAGGIQEETFPNFTYGSNQVFRPYVSIQLF